MHATVFLRSRSYWFLPAIVVLFCCGSLSPAQTQAPVSVQTQKPGPVTDFDPTKREAQPSLDIDRDPVLSLDPVDNAPVNPAGVSKEQNRNGVFTLSEDVNEVLQYCTVVDDKGRLVTDLKPSNFHVWEDGVPQTISSFQQRDLPVSIGLLVDNSGSMHDKRGVVNSASVNLMRASNPQDAAFIVNFSDKAYLDQGFTSDISLIEKGLARFDSKGTTAIYDTVVVSADELSRHAKWPKQVLLIITDGGDNASRLTLQQAVHRVQQLGGPVVYSIGLLYDADSKDEAQQAKEALETLSNDTGGIAYFPQSLEGVNEIASEVAHDIRNQYAVGYHPKRSASLGGYRTVRVEAEAPGHGKLIVRTRTGYYPGQPGQTPSVTGTVSQVSP